MDHKHIKQQPAGQQGACSGAFLAYKPYTTCGQQWDVTLDENIPLLRAQPAARAVLKPSSGLSKFQSYLRALLLWACMLRAC